MYERTTKKHTENNTGSLKHLNYESERSGSSSTSTNNREKKRNVLLSDDCYNLIMFWALIVRNIINGNWMMSWDCNTSQSIFNAGMSFRYVTVVFFSGADHYAFNHCSWILFPSFYLLFLSLSLSLSCCHRHVHHFSFFCHFTACGFLSLGSLFFFLAKL